MGFKQYLIEKVKGTNEEISEFLYQTHYIENEVPKGQEGDFKELVDGWVDFAYGSAKRPPSESHRGIMGHITVMQKYGLPKSVNDVAKIYKELGESDVLRTKGHDVNALGSKVEYTKGENVNGELEKWVKTTKHGSMQSHVDFELIHPADDGNGRTGRLLMLLGGYPIGKLNNLINNKGKYIRELEKFDKSI